MAMTSLKQVEANRRNAVKSTGPTSEVGKNRSRRNAIRHGLTAETVVEPLEDPEEYRTFELSITSEFDAQTAVERELVLRLASVFWRLRRSTVIETALLQLAGPMTSSGLPETKTLGAAGEVQGNDARGSAFDSAVHCPNGENAVMARRFLRLAKFDNGAFERLNRYETALWRQATQLLFALNFLRRPQRRQGAFPLTREIPFLFGRRR
jgi:hypothetical protein